jgi:hypothetical protein
MLNPAHIRKTLLWNWEQWLPTIAISHGSNLTLAMNYGDTFTKFFFISSKELGRYVKKNSNWIWPVSNLRPFAQESSAIHINHLVSSRAKLIPAFNTKWLCCFGRSIEIRVQ